MQKYICRYNKIRIDVEVFVFPLENQNLLKIVNHLINICPKTGICKRVRDASIYTSKKYRSSFYS